MPTQYLEEATRSKGYSIIECLPNDSRHLRDQRELFLFQGCTSIPTLVALVSMFLRSFILDQHLKKTFQVESLPVENSIRDYTWVWYPANWYTQNRRWKSELTLGVDEQDWSKIKQVLVEVHDLDNRVEKITDLLKTYGLQEIIVEQEPVFKETNILIYMHGGNKPYWLKAMMTEVQAKCTQVKKSTDWWCKQSYRFVEQAVSTRKLVYR